MKSNDRKKRARTTITEKIGETTVEIRYSKKCNLSDAGPKRNSIDPNRLLSQINKSIHHLDWYCRTVKEFAYDNKPDGGFRIKVALQETIDRQMLNVVIEVHLLSLNSIRLTVITATLNDGFRFREGQYGIVFKGNNSQLIIQENGTKKVINSI